MGLVTLRGPDEPQGTVVVYVGESSLVRRALDNSG